MNRVRPSRDWRPATSPAEHHDDSLSTGKPSYLVPAIILGAVAYNALLAWAAARNFAIGQQEVIAAEFALLGAAILVVAASGRRMGDGAAFLLLVFFVVNALLVSIPSNGLFPAMARNGAIIALFLLLGLRITQPTLRLSVAVSSGVVAAVLLLEVLSPSTYVELFQPSSYYEATRDIDPLETVGGLFRNASGFEGRFTLVGLLDHRASSIFLEPVSLGNFGVFLIGYLVCFWTETGRKEKTAYIALTVLILATTNSRLLFAFILLSPIIYRASAKVDRGLRLLVVPGIFLLGMLVYATGYSVEADDLLGRISKTMHTLGDMNVQALAGLQPGVASDFSDSGYTYIIYASSALGLIAVWLFVSLIVPASSLAQRRAGLFLCLYYFISLLISGNSVFSIKVAALLWLLVGFVSRSQHAAAALSPASRPASDTGSGWRTEERSAARARSRAW